MNQPVDNFSSAEAKAKEYKALKEKFVAKYGNHYEYKQNFYNKGKLIDNFIKSAKASQVEKSNQSFNYENFEEGVQRFLTVWEYQDLFEQSYKLFWEHNFDAHLNPIFDKLLNLLNTIQFKISKIYQYVLNHPSLIFFLLMFKKNNEEIMYFGTSKRSYQLLNELLLPSPSKAQPDQGNQTQTWEI